MGLDTIKKASDKNATHRIQPIDSWRAIAALGVVWIHCWSHFGNPSLFIWKIDLYKLMTVFGNGVDFFFVISGFCLYIVWRNKMVTINTYWVFVKKRWLRIAPAFYAAALIIATVNYILSKQPVLIPMLGNIFFVQNFSPAFSISPPFWSLAVEFHFYLLLPLFMYYAYKNFFKTFLVTMLIGIVLLAYYHKLESYYFLQSKILHFAIGLLAAWCFFERKPIMRLLNNWYAFFIAVGVLFIGRFLLADGFIGEANKLNALYKVLGTGLLVTGFAATMLVTITHTTLQKWFSNKPMLWLGKLSYSIYLWHAFTITIAIKIFPTYLQNNRYTPLLFFVFVTIALIPISFVSYAFFEQAYFKSKNIFVKKS